MARSSQGSVSSEADECVLISATQKRESLLAPIGLGGVHLDGCCPLVGSPPISILQLVNRNDTLQQYDPFCAVQSTPEIQCSPGALALREYDIHSSRIRTLQDLVQKRC